MQDGKDQQRIKPEDLPVHKQHSMLSGEKQKCNAGRLFISTLFSGSSHAKIHMQ
jgi:hypothetical protein